MAHLPVANVAPKNPEVVLSGHRSVTGGVRMKHARVFALVLGFALVVAACGGDDDTTTTTQGATTTQATSPAEETPTETSPAADDSMAEDDPMMDADATIADLRSRIEGQSVVVGSSGFPNASLTGAFRTMDFLRDDFGLDVEFRLLDSDPLVAATIAGEVEVGQLSLAGMANAVSAGSDFVAFGGDDQKNSFIIAAKAPIATMEELRGHPVAATQSLNQITGQTLQKCLADVGMTVDDVQLVRLAHTGEATQAITSGQVVGGISATWRLTQLTLNEGEGAYNMLCAGWESNPQISSVWYAERDWVDANPDMALAFNIASLKSARWTQEDKQRWMDYAMSVNDNLTPEAASLDYDSLVGELDMWPVNGSLDYDLMQTTLDTSFAFEAVDREYTVEELVTFEFQDQALEILGVAEYMPDIDHMDDPMMDADATIADLRSRIEGQSVVVGSSGFPNASLTGAFRTMDFLRDDFGLDVEFRLLDSDPLVAATIAGEVEVGQLSLAGMANAVSAGSDFVAFGGDDQKNSFIIAAKAPIATMEELRGHPVAATQSLNQITGQTLQKCLADVGMTVDDVQLVRLAHTGEATQAITSGQVVGGISATWRLTQLTLNEGEGAYNMLCAGWESNPQISSVWYAERDWVDANPDMALAFNIASLKSARWTQEDKQRWMDYAMSVNDNLTPEAASLDYDSLVGELDMWPVNGSLDYDLMQTTLDTSFAFEAVDREYTVEELVAFEFQDQALEILGRS